MNIDKIIQFLIVIIIFIIIIILLRQAVAEKKEKRIAYYSLEPLKDASIPLIDKIKNKYLIFVQKNRQILLKIDYFKKKSKKYEKYIKYRHRDKISAIDFITNKDIICIISSHFRYIYNRNKYFSYSNRYNSRLLFIRYNFEDIL